MKNYDIAIIGAGPAGSTLARMLDEKYDVLLLDNNESGKVCGGIISPDAQKKFAEYDINMPKDVLVNPQIFSVKTMDLETKQKRNYYRNYINIDRYKFDKWLVSLVGKNVDMRCSRCRQIEKIGDTYKLIYDNGSKREECTVNIVVGADGANSFVRNTFFKNALKTREYVAIQQWFDESSDNADVMYACIFDQKTSPVCSWIISKDGNSIFGGAFKKENCREKFDLQLSRMERMGYKFGKPIKTEACIVFRPKNLASFYHGNDNIYLIGEAAGYISPSSMEGISYAFITAEKLANALNKNINNRDDNKINIGKMYANSTKKTRYKLILKRLKELLMYRPFFRKLILKSGFTSLK